MAQVLHYQTDIYTDDYIKYQVLTYFPPLPNT